jgi:hypothetical protein
MSYQTRKEFITKAMLAGTALTGGLKTFSMLPKETNYSNSSLKKLSDTASKISNF